MNTVVAWTGVEHSQKDVPNWRRQAPRKLQTLDAGEMAGRESEDTPLSSSIKKPKFEFNSTGIGQGICACAVGWLLVQTQVFPSSPCLTCGSPDSLDDVGDPDAFHWWEIQAEWQKDGGCLCCVLTPIRDQHCKNCRLQQNCLRDHNHCPARASPF